MNTFKNGDIVIYNDSKGRQHKTKVWVATKKRVLIENWKKGDDEFGNPYAPAVYVRPENLTLFDKGGLVFSFWKNNKKDQHFTLTIGELVTRFHMWVDYQINENKERGQKWYEYYYGRQAVCCFIGDKEEIFGLQSVNDTKEFDSMYEWLRKHFK